MIDLKINYPNRQARKQLHTLKNGEAFYYDNRIFIKLKKESYRSNLYDCIELSADNGLVYRKINEMFEVEPTNLDITVEIKA